MSTEHTTTGNRLSSAIQRLKTFSARRRVHLAAAVSIAKLGLRYSGYLLDEKILSSTFYHRIEFM